MTNEIIAIESVAQRILVLRGKKVMVDADLAELYGVPTKALNQAVHRNLERFPAVLCFSLHKKKKSRWSQIVTTSPSSNFHGLCLMPSRNMAR
ncbi:ORF6N domain-containing protein [Ferrigenium sp. UT5]|uniref:ORF6N domain-containing protein n=1 Tax=Ferrigenium sp. UT5 TaxID=3242105 RepID=UPI0038B32B9C